MSLRAERSNPLTNLEIASPHLPWWAVPGNSGSQNDINTIEVISERT